MNDQVEDKGFIANNKKKLAAAGAAALISGGAALTIDFSTKNTGDGNITAETVNQQDSSVKTGDISSEGNVTFGGQK